MYKLPYAEFYITNVCNLNCTNCNRFNNFSFAGHELWGQYQDLYTNWAKRLTIDHISILGGEPFLNPSLLEWVDNILSLWPTSKLSIVTNGTQFNKWPALYPLLLKHKEKFWLETTIHSIALKDKILNDLTNFLQGPIKCSYNRNTFSDKEWQRMWNIIRGPDWPDCPSAEHFYSMPQWIQDECNSKHNLGHQQWIDANGVRVDVSVVTKFMPSAVIPHSNTQTFKLHNSDPKKAIEVCISKKCHHFSYGQLYKCGVVGILPNFDNQFYLDISDSDRKLMLSYKPAEVTWSDNDLSPFLNNLITGQAIDQCKFCPEIYKEIEFESNVKKIKFIKKNF
jgi:organic radical activating enzyme